ncbi:MAG TPA: hypothetical protein VNJ53_03890 [Gaiellaceae bacterium]|nr:hypothetical protein [Gaiellaceae bacterium]
MSRTTTLILVALGAALVGFVFSSAADRFRDEDSGEGASVAARPQAAELGWRERFRAGNHALVFGVERFEVVPGGWRAEISIANETTTAFGVGDPRATLDRQFGVMLFATGKRDELERLNARGALPTLRAATAFEPPLPKILEPGEEWSGTISAPGALVAGSWVRVVFGALVAVGKPPEGLPARVVWISDHAYELAT